MGSNRTTCPDQTLAIGAALAGRSLPACAIILVAAADAHSDQPVPATRSVADFGAVGDGIHDDSAAIQQAIDAGHNGVWCNPCNVLFPAGKTYRISHQLVLWSAVHLDTDPENPTTILLAPHTPGFQDARRPLYMLRGRLSAARPDCPDNNFWTQMRHLKFRIARGNPGAAGIYLLAAQGTLLDGVTVDMEDGKCAVTGCGMVVNCTFRGGRLGLVDPSLAEHGLVMNCHFVGQTEAAYSLESGWCARTFIGTTFEQTPLAVCVGHTTQLVMIECKLIATGLGASLGDPAIPVLIQNLRAHRTPYLYRTATKVLAGSPEGSTVLPTLVVGDVSDNGKWVQGGGLLRTSTRLPTWNSVPAGIDLSHAINVRDFGAVGDGKADDTEALRRAVAAGEVVYLPAGNYRVTDTILLRRDTRLVGEHVLASCIRIAPGTPGLTDAADPKPILDTPDAADTGFRADHNSEPLILYNSSSEHQRNRAFDLRGAKDATLCFCGGGEGGYPGEKVMNSIEGGDRVALISFMAHPTDDANDPQTMTVVRATGTPGLWIGPLKRIHDEPVLHTVLDTRPQGDVVDLGNRGFVLYRWGELNQEEAVTPDAWFAVEPGEWLVSGEREPPLPGLLDARARPATPVATCRSRCRTGWGASPAQPSTGRRSGRHRTCAPTRCPACASLPAPGRATSPRPYPAQSRSPPGREARLNSAPCAAACGSSRAS